MKTPEAWALDVCMGIGLSLSNREFEKLAAIIRSDGEDRVEAKARELMGTRRAEVRKMIDEWGR